MSHHVIPPSDQIKLFELEVSKDYEGCSQLLETVLSGDQRPDSHDQSYELGAAYLKLSVFQLMQGLGDASERNFATADALLPRPDLLALASIWLARNQAMPGLVSDFRAEFFDLVDEGYATRDAVSQSYFDAMMDLSTG